MIPNIASLCTLGIFFLTQIFVVVPLTPINFEGDQAMQPITTCYLSFTNSLSYITE
jgi:hypothetical protein